MNEIKLNDIADDLLIINKTTIDKLFALENSAECVALYIFYYKTSKWQKTNKIKANDEYVKKCLKWGYDKIRKTKQTLKENGLIEIIQDRKEGRICGWYIKVSYLVSKKSIDDIKIKVEEQEVNTPDKQEVGNSRSGEQNLSALKDNNISALKEIEEVNNNIEDEAKALKKDTLYDYLQNNGFVLSPIHYEEVSTWEDTELTRYAIKEAVLKNIYTIKYISTVLNAYKQNNIKTVQQAQEHEARRTQSFNKQPQPKKKDYRDVLDEWLAEKQAEDERRLANDLSRSY